MKTLVYDFEKIKNDETLEKNQKQLLMKVTLMMYLNQSTVLLVQVVRFRRFRWNYWFSQRS